MDFERQNWELKVNPRVGSRNWEALEYWIAQQFESLHILNIYLETIQIYKRLG